MGRIVEADYDAKHQALQLMEPLDGVGDGQRVEIMVNAEPMTRDPDWWRFCGVLSGEKGESFARAIEEAFPIER
jgi:hypothetical protein